MPLRLVSRLRVLTAVALLLAWGVRDGSAQPAYRVKDINQTQPEPQAVDVFAESEAVGDVLYFVLEDGLSGREIWRTDGTAAGTRLVKDVCPGSCSPDPAFLTSSNGLLFFVAFDGDLEKRLWRSDGTPQGTWTVTDLATIDDLSISLLDAGGTLYFAATDPDHGTELWATDGTPAGTRRVADAVPGPGSSSPNLLAAANGLILFSANFQGTGREPWLTDGTGAGTRMLADLHPGPPSSILVYADARRRAAAAPWGGFVFAGDSLGGGGIWATDGTAQGTEFLKAVGDGLFSIPYDLTALGQRVVFVADNALSGVEPWVTDGTAAGTHLLKDVRPGTPDSSPQELTAAGDRVFFRADDGVHGSELWATDGTTAGTGLVLEIQPSLLPAFPEPDSNRYGLSPLGGRLVFFAYAPGYFRLWESDGTAAGTRPVGPQTGSWPEAASLRMRDGYGVAGGRFFFRAGSGGGEMWTADGTPAGPVRIKSALQLSSAFTLNNGRIVYPRSFADFGGTLLFQASDGVSGAEPWRSDGTAAGTWRIKDLLAGSFSSIPREFSPVANGRVFLTNGGLGVTDGTAAGTSELSVTGTIETIPMGAGVQFLAADAQQPGLWTSDGTPAGTYRLVAIPRDTLSLPPQMTLSGGKLFFRLDSLWVSDSTPAGTTALGAAAGLVPVGLTDVEGTLFYKASSAAAGFELWKSDGTLEGTGMVKDIRPGSPHSMFSQYWEPMATLPNGRIVFTADDGDTGVEPWVSDGTEAGTVRILDILPGLGGSEPRGLTRIGGRVYFSANDGVHGREPWVTDGTPQGTRMVRDVAPGPLASRPDSFAGIDSYAVFAAYDEIHGTEIWRSDGSETGTRRLQDIAPGPGSSFPTEFTPVGDRIFFAANDNVTGWELWAMPRTAVRAAFADVPYEYWAWSYVEALARAGITRGCAEGLYCPLHQVTRAEMAVFLGRALHGGTFTPPPATGTRFTDVPTAYWAAAWIEQFAADGITTGCAPNRYCPDALVSRAEMAVFLLRSKHGAAYTPPPATGTRFTDVPTTYWAAAWIEQLAAEGITTGCAPNRYCPDSSVSRDQMAAFLVRTFGLP